MSILILIFWWTLSQPIPCGGFEYVEDILKFITDFTINSDKNSDFGYTLLVNVDYSEYLEPLYKRFTAFTWKK